MLRSPFLALMFVPVFGLLPSLAQQASQRTVWDGVFSEEQAERGATVYSGVCAKCHGRSGNGAAEPDQPESPSVARQAFLTKWEGRSVEALFEYVRTTMPFDNPASRSDQDYIDAIAHMFVLSDMPTGQEELPADGEALSQIVITTEAP